MFSCFPSDHKSIIVLFIDFLRNCNLGHVLVTWHDILSSVLVISTTGRSVVYVRTCSLRSINSFTSKGQRFTILRNHAHSPKLYRVIRLINHCMHRHIEILISQLITHNNFESRNRSSHYTRNHTKTNHENLK